MTKLNPTHKNKQATKRTKQEAQRACSHVCETQGPTVVCAPAEMHELCYMAARLQP